MKDKQSPPGANCQMLRRKKMFKLIDNTQLYQDRLRQWEKESEKYADKIRLSFIPVDWFTVYTIEGFLDKQEEK